MQLHEGVVVGRKTCVDALLGERVATCVEMGCSLRGNSSQCSSLRWMVKMQLITEELPPRSVNGHAVSCCRGEGPPASAASVVRQCRP